MKEVYVAHATTESCDHYHYAFDYKPTREEVISQVHKDEGECEDLEWYLDLTTVDIFLLQIQGRE